MARLISTKRLLLTPLTTEDIAFLDELWTAPEGHRYLWNDRIIDVTEVHEIIDTSIAEFALSGLGFGVIRTADDGRPVGFTGLRKFGDAGNVELMYGLGVESRGQGFATEAAVAVLDYGFQECGLPEIYAETDPPNTASVCVLERLGMKYSEERVPGAIPAVYYVQHAAEFGGQEG